MTNIKALLALSGEIAQNVSIPTENRLEIVMNNSFSTKIAHFAAFVIVATITAVPAAVNAFHSSSTDQVQYGDALYATGLQMSLHKDAASSK